VSKVLFGQQQEKHAKWGGGGGRGGGIREVSRTKERLSPYNNHVFTLYIIKYIDTVKANGFSLSKKLKVSCIV
jgi:hypothetical protein